jgi:hypothetical protein
MVAFYRLFAWHAILEVYQIFEPVPTLNSLGAAPFSSDFLLILRGTIGFPTRHAPFGCFLLHDQPSLGQQLFFSIDHEYFYFLSTDPCYYGDMHPGHG